jgi:soluble lytic murein transglycosylase
MSQMLYKFLFGPVRAAALPPVFCALACLALAAPAAAQTAPSGGNGAGDNVLIEMNKAFKRGDRGRLAQLLPQAKGHALEPWAAYWELKLRLGEAGPQEVQDFSAATPAPTRKTGCATTGCCCWASAATGPALPPNIPTTA